MVSYALSVMHTVAALPSYKKATNPVATVKHSATADDTDIINEKYDLTLFAKSKKTHDYIFVRCNMN